MMRKDLLEPQIPQITQILNSKITIHAPMRETCPWTAPFINPRHPRNPRFRTSVAMASDVGHRCVARTGAVGSPEI
jgi:hypothetical protein